MAFKIYASSENGIDLVNLIDEATHTRVSIVPEYGAMLHAFSVETRTGVHNIIDNYATAEDIRENLATSFRSSKLSPFVCRIPEGKYLYDGVEFEFPDKFLDGSAIHGLLYNTSFALVSEFADDEQASVSFKYNYKEDNEGYPFNYRCEIRYALKPMNILQIQTTILNLDDLPIPIADGWHPYFTLGGKINDWLLYFNADAILEFDDKLIPTGQLLAYNEFNEEKMIASTQLDNCFLLNIDEGYAACTLRNASNDLQLNFFPDNTYPYLQIYTPPHRNSIAIENLSAAPNAFNNKMGLLMLAPRHTHTFTIHYQLGCK
jgi:aldose 1-epimerase